MQTRNEILDLNFHHEMLTILSHLLRKGETQSIRKGYLTISSSLHDSIFGRKHGAGEGIRIHHSLQLSQVMQQILRKVY